MANELKKINLTDSGYTADGKWRLVPVEATPEITDEILMVVDDDFDARVHASECAYWQAVKAAPNPPAGLFDTEPVADADGWIPYDVEATGRCWGWGMNVTPEVSAAIASEFAELKAELEQEKAGHNRMAQAWHAAEIKLANAEHAVCVKASLYPQDMRHMLTAIQEGEISISKGVEYLREWVAGTFRESLLPDIRGVFGEDELAADTVIVLRAELEQERKLLEWALNNGAIFDDQIGVLYWHPGPQGKQLRVETTDPRATIGELMKG